MTVWVEKINVKQYLSDSDTTEAVRAAASGVVKELKRLRRRIPPEDIVFAFEDLAAHGIGPGDVWVFNDVLSDLYDWADHRRVWLGP